MGVGYSTPKGEKPAPVVPFDGAFNFVLICVVSLVTLCLCFADPRLLSYSMIKDTFTLKVTMHETQTDVHVHVLPDARV